jgi:iron complex outermembrane receptor protein
VAYCETGENQPEEASQLQGSEATFGQLKEEQKQEDLGIFGLSLEELMQIKVTGSTLTEETLKKVPSSVTVFTRKEISRLGIDTLEELMNFVPGFQSYRQGEHPQHRGFSSRGRKIGVTGREVLVLKDGERISNSLNTGMALTSPLIPLANIKQVEFIRGPGSAIYGSNAFLGVVNILTVRDVNEVSLSYGENNMRSGHVLASGNLSNFEFSSFARYFADDGEDYRVQDTFSANRIITSDPQDGGDLQVWCRWHQTEIKFDHIKRSGEDFYIFDGISNGFNDSNIRNSNVSIEQHIEWNLDFESNILLSHRWYKWEENAQLTPAGLLEAISAPPSADPLFIKSVIEDKEIRFQMHNDWKIRPNVSFQFGLEYRRPEWEEVIAENNFDLGDFANGNFPVSYYGDFSHYTSGVEPGNRDILGIYSQYRMPILESTNLTLGLRYDHYDGIGSRVSPRVGLVHQLTDNHTVKLLYGEAFRVPSVNELETINNPILIGNPDLDPETVKTWELIWMSNWEKAMLAISLFDNTFEDSIIQDVVGGTRTFVNSRKEESRGIETELSTQIGERWYFRTTFTHIFDTPDSAFRESENLASFILNYHLDAWNFNLGATFQDEKKMAVGSTDNLVKLDSFWVTNAKIKYAFLNNWTAFLQAKNLFDEDYETPPQGTGLTEGVPNRGVEVSAGMTWEF